MADVYKFNPFTSKLDNSGPSTSPSGSPVGTDRQILTTSPLSGGGDLSADRTIAITSPLPVANGGTALGSYAVGDLLVASGTGTLASLADVATGQVLASGGTNTLPAYTSTPTVTSITTATVFGGTGASGNLILQSTSNATRGNVQVEDLMQVGTSTHAWGATTGFYIDIATSGSATITTGALTGMRFAPTLTCGGNSASTLMALFNDQCTVKDDGTARTLGPGLIFAAQSTYNTTITNGLTVNDLAGIPAYCGFYFALTTTRVTTATATMTTACGLYISGIANIGAGWTITNYVGMLIDKPTVGGTVTNFYGIKNNGAAATNNWFLYETGGMQSSHKGNLRIGDNTAPTAVLDVKGTINCDQNIANNTVATVLGSVGPTGSHTTVQEWLKININGTTRYLPCF